MAIGEYAFRSGGIRIVLSPFLQRGTTLTTVKTSLRAIRSTPTTVRVLGKGDFAGESPFHGARHWVCACAQAMVSHAVEVGWADVDFVSGI